MAKLQTSPGNAHSPSRLCPPHIRTSSPYRYWTLKIIASSSSLHASYAISVRRASALPAASFRFHLTMDTLAVRLTIPPVGFVGDFHSLVSAPCRAHNAENDRMLRRFHIETDNIGRFPLKVGIVGHHVALDPLGLQSRSLPDPRHHHVMHTQVLGQFARAPVGRPVGGR